MLPAPGYVVAGNWIVSFAVWRQANHVPIGMILTLRVQSFDLYSQ